MPGSVFILLTVTILLYVSKVLYSTTLTVEKSDEVDEWMWNRQNFPYQNFALKKYCIIYGYNLLT